MLFQSGYARRMKLKLLFRCMRAMGHGEQLESYLLSVVLPSPARVFRCNPRSRASICSCQCSKLIKSMLHVHWKASSHSLFHPSLVGLSKEYTRYFAEQRNMPVATGTKRVKVRTDLKTRTRKETNSDTGRISVQTIWSANIQLPLLHA